MLTYAKIVAGAISLLKSLAAALQQHHNEVMAALVQKGATDAATLKTLEAVSAPVSIAERDKLWDVNVSKFGPGVKPPGD